MKFNIGEIEIGDQSDVLVIPEIGINHNGSLQAAKEMADAAYKAGARLVKHQTHIVEDEMSVEARKVIPGNSEKSIYSIMEECALNEEEEYEFMRYVKERGMEFISTPFSRKAADRLEKFGVNAYKIGSGEMNNIPLIEHVAEFGKPMIVSTGMNTLKSVSETVNVLEKYGVPYALLHTTNLYPTMPGQVRLGAMTELMNEFKGIPVGLSDHTTSNLACVAAIALGAKIVERHFTDNKNRVGPDIVCSMDQEELGQLIADAAAIMEMSGGSKQPIPEEQVTIDFAFASVVTLREIKAGETFTRDNLWVKRPGTGEIPAREYRAVLGKRAAEDIAADSLLEREMIL